MKLIYRIILYITLALTIVLSAWALFFYVAMIDEVNDEVDDSLEDYSEAIIIRALAGEELPSTNNGSNNQYYLEEITKEYAVSHEGLSYKDSMIYITEKGETEPARILSTIFRNESDQYFELTVSIPTIEKEDLKDAILNWIIFLYITLLVIILLICIWIFYRNMKPLYVLLNWLDKYRTGKENEPLSNNTKITEFRKLNDAAIRNASRNEQLFEQQKQFIGNASHEIQTPLAICRNRLEILMEDESLTESQLKELVLTHQTLEYITKLNKSLLLLSKIDNHQFSETKEIEFNSILRRLLEDFREVYAYRNINIVLNEKALFRLTMNESLATVLITNLLKNAFVHNVDGGHVCIETTNSSLQFRNSGVNHSLDKASIFERFYQGNKKEGSTGLGLAIADSICKLEEIRLDYCFENDEHVFTISSE